MVEKNDPHAPENAAQALAARLNEFLQDPDLLADFRAGTIIRITSHVTLKIK